MTSHTQPVFSSFNRPGILLALWIFCILAAPATQAQTTAPAPSPSLCGNQKIDTGEDCDGDLTAYANAQCTNLDELLPAKTAADHGSPSCEKAARYLRKHYCDPKTCKIQNYCGNGVIDTTQGETCDPQGGVAHGVPVAVGLRNAKTEYCSSNCTVKSYCGNGFVNRDRGEQCDGAAGLLAPGEYCTTECRKRTSFCGNGNIEGAEECDSPERQEFTGKDGRPSFCKKCREVPLCGNSRIDKKYGEACDGKAIPPSWIDTDQYCSTTCQAAKSVCGNHIIEGFEECDEPEGTVLNNGRTVCTHCVLIKTCGNGKLDTQLGEICDPTAPIPAGATALSCTGDCLRPQPLLPAPSVPICSGHRSAFFKNICDQALPEATGCTLGPKACADFGLTCNDDETSPETLVRACYTAPPLTRALGVCHEGIQTLVDGQWSACQNEMSPWLEQNQESCDGLDNNCNGSIDEGCLCEPEETHRCGTDVGECRMGIQKCEKGRMGTCQGAVLPQPESCDHKDNDCDGLTDLGL